MSAKDYSGDKGHSQETGNPRESGRPEGKDDAGEKAYSAAELMTVVMARHLRDGEVAVMGAVSMIPMAACRLAQETHAPNLSYIAGGSGAVNPRLEPLVFSSCAAENLRADAMLPLPDVILLEGHGKRFDVFFGGGLQIDKYGNCNLVCVGDWHNPLLKGPGTVGLPFLPRAGRAVLYTTAHNARTFVEKVDFNSGPGFLDGPETWLGQGLPGEGPALVVTPLCVFDFEERSKVMRLKSLHPGVSREEVVRNTGFRPALPPEVPVTPEPTLSELVILRRLDAAGVLGKLV
ncbi:Coenzyme A transferase family I [Acididesulfobacillus acetoxydans]|uniref:3-oxoadipate CoA-transferase subunit B n=1 Tax=Acididesulfobacillus acetoxydans TaxID=1561005 RepID=A0A8S0XWL2_9FIRM|nr:CoA-transferase [Acididesulfobacillus acetoxydans]CAA7601107.1 Coenzyme A transferase family I [Acididesulfobacillus acetoxydans]CEJ06981.1 3-oxoadipate CoA-transferase subunit B [Acididesulfobacillus acetoxydans]